MSTEALQDGSDGVQGAAESIAKDRRKMRKAGIADVPDQQSGDPGKTLHDDVSGPVAKPITDKH